MSLKVEILTTGDELLRGDVVNSNAAWLATRLKQLGYSLVQVVTVGDDQEAIVSAIVEAAARCQVLLVSGGLGPTSDDRTSAAVAQAAGVKLELNPIALQMIEERFARLGYQLTANNKKQAFLPQTAIMIPNDQGTAPGFSIRLKDCRIFCMPGVPHELMAMFDGHVASQMQAEFRTPSVIIRSLNIFGLGESQIDDRLADLLTEIPLRGCEATVHYRTSFPENRVILVVRSPSPNLDAEAQAVLADLEAAVRKRLHHFIFSTDETSFSEALVKSLKECGATLSIAESCSGGLAGDLVTGAPGSSDVFHLGVVAYSNYFKQQILGVPDTLIQRFGAVSRECAESMAQGIRRVTGSTYGLAITGIAGPSGGTPEKPVGTVHFALASAQGVRHLHRQFPFERQRIKLISAYTGLALVLYACQQNLNEEQDPFAGRWAGR